MKRNTIISVVLWAVIAGALVVFFNAYRGNFALPEIVLLVPALAIVVYYLGWRGKREQGTHDLIFGRFGPKALMTIASALFVIAVAWVAFFARTVQNDPDKVLYAVVIPVLAMIVVGGVLMSVGIYQVIKRN